MLFMLGQLVVLSRRSLVGFETLRKLADAPVRNWATMRLQLLPIPTLRGREETGYRGRIMSNLDEMLKKVRKLQLRAAIAKTNLRDLAEGLPVKWTEIEEVAEKAHAVYAELHGARRELAKMKTLR